MASAPLLCALLVAPVAPAQVPGSSAPPAEASAPPPARAEVQLSERSVIGTFVTILLDNGDTLRGTVLEVDEGIVQLQHAVLGEVQIPRTRIVRALVGEVDGAALIRPPTRREPDPTPTTVTPILPPPPDVEPAPAPAPPPPPRVKWDREIEIGLTGSTGNSERQDIQAGFRLRRTGDATTFLFNSRYRLALSDGDRVVNRLLLNARGDWGLNDPDWSVFAQGGFEYDEFRDFEVRLSAGAGLAYRFIGNDDTTLRGRLGFGASRDLSGPNQDIVPELITALELNHKINNTQRLIGSVEVFPDATDFSDFRSVIKAEWQLRLNNDNNLFLRLGAEHRYETNTTRSKRSDLDYFARLVYGF